MLHRNIILKYTITRVSVAAPNGTVESRGRRAVPAAAERRPPYTTRRSPFVSTGTDRVQAEQRIQADSSAAPRGLLSQ